MEDEESIYDDVRRLIAVSPDKIQYDSKESVVFVFNNPLPEDGGPYEVKFKGEQRCLLVPAIQLNSFTLQINAPVYYPAEKTAVTIHDKIKRSEPPLGESSFEFLSRCQLLQNLLDKTTDPESLLCESLGFSMTDMKIFDDALADRIKEKFPKGFNMINEQVIDRFAIGGPTSTTAYPTIIHFGAAYGLLQTVTTCLKICPAVLKACALKNSEGLLPREIAQKRGHHLLSEELRTFQLQNKENISADKVVGDDEDPSTLYVEMSSGKDCDKAEFEEQEDQYVECAPASPTVPKSPDCPEIWYAIGIAERAVNESWRRGNIEEDTAKLFTRLVQKAARQEDFELSPPRKQFKPTIPSRLYLETKRHSIHDIPQSVAAPPPLPPRSPRLPPRSPRSPPEQLWNGLPETRRSGSVPNLAFTFERTSDANGCAAERPHSPLIFDGRPPPPSSPIPSRATRIHSVDFANEPMSPRLKQKRHFLTFHRHRSLSHDADNEHLEFNRRRRALSQADQDLYLM